MNILFLDKGNVARSRMAEIFFNNLTGKNKALSAGTNATRWQNKFLSEFAEPMVRCMADEGYDVSKDKTVQLTQKMVDDADRIVSLEPKDELPDYVKNTSKQLIFWEVENPREKSYEFHCKVRDHIKKLIEELIGDIE